MKKLVIIGGLCSVFLGGCVAYVPAHRREVVVHPRVEVRPAPPPVIVVPSRRRYYYSPGY